jgi:NAD(P)-dependent dehydrogenase (short-subunit alcohol dehydrogenase family)
MMARRLEGKVAIVTGSTSGIGEGIAVALAREGAAVVVSGRRADRGEAIVKAITDAGGKAIFHEADLMDAAQCKPLIQRAVDELGGIDILVNNAGIFPRITFEETTIDDWDRVFDLNARAAYFCAQAATPHMRSRGGGSIVNIGSTHPFGVGEGQFVYGISKGALYTMTRKLAMLLARDRIRVNWISVGWVLTEQERELRNVPDDDREWVESHKANNPLGDFVSVEDVAEGVIYLAADSGRSVTGTDLGVNGGITVHM